MGWWAMAMIPFCYVVMTLVSGLNDATAKQPDSVKGLVVMARYLTVISWLTYPGVYIIKNMGLAGRRCLASSFGPLLRGSLLRSRGMCCWGDSGISSFLARVQFSKFSSPSVQRRRLPLAWVWREQLADQSYLSGTGQSTSFRNCKCDRNLSCVAHFPGQKGAIS